MSQRTRLMEERARALATVLLTSRDDLQITDLSDEDMGIAYLVTIHFDRPGLRQFGVVLRTRLSPVTADEANKVLKTSLAKTARYGPFPYPVCLFFFTMMESQSWYAWLMKPVHGPDGSLNLAMQQEISSQPLDLAALDGIVALVHEWYDVTFAS